MLPTRPSIKDREIAFHLGLEFEDAEKPAAESLRLISARTVRGILGDISDMTLWRWLSNEEMAFPRPLVLARNRYWREAEVRAWIDQRTSKQAEAPTA